MSEPVTLAQIVAALLVTYTPNGVLMWLTAKNKALSNGRFRFSPEDYLADGRFDEIAELVRRIGDADPAGFTITDTRSGT